MIGCIAIPSMMSGCSQPVTLSESTALRDAAVPCDVKLDLLVVWPSQGKAERIRVDRGILGWGGGQAAIGEMVTWKTPMTEQGCASIDNIVLNLCRDFPSSDPPTHTVDQVDLVIRCDGRDHRVMVSWPNDQLMPLYQALESLCKARFTPSLDRLPKAGEKFGP
ncbi:MAG: hypothetical protein O2800_00770 [Planctomycetota bacterium]|nr:hypothetical protein [Planctomycetota bacterium]